MKEGWKLMANKAEHVRSHQLEGPDAIDIETVDRDSRHRLLGNQLADEAAGEGQKMHPEFDPVLLALDRRAYKAAQQVVLLAAKVMPLHPRRALHRRQAPPDPPIQTQSDDEDQMEKMEKLSRGQADDEKHEPQIAGPVFDHQWRECEPGRWRCSSCASVVNSGKSAPPVLSGCRGIAVALSRVGVGHRMVIFHPTPTNPDPTPLYACELCHSCGNSRPGTFADACPSTPTPAKSRGYRRLEAGMHPHPRRGSQALYGPGYFL